MKRQLLIAASLMIASGAVCAASQGTQGTTSSGNTVINLNNNQRVIVTGIENIDTDGSTFDGTNPLVSGLMTFCIGSNTTTHIFDVQMQSQSAGAGSSYFVTDGAATPQTVTYQATFYPNATGTGGTVLDGAAQDTITGVDLSADPRNLGDCATAGDNVSMQVTFDPTDLASATSLTYSDTLNIIVAPQ